MALNESHSNGEVLQAQTINELAHETNLLTERVFGAIETKTYSGLYYGANSTNSGIFCPLCVKPKDATKTNGVYHVKLRMSTVCEPAESLAESTKNAYKSYKNWTIADLWLNPTGSVNCYALWNWRANNYLHYYLRAAYPTTNADWIKYGTHLGVGIESGNNYNSASYPRTTTFELLEISDDLVYTFDEPSALKQYIKMQWYLDAVNTDKITISLANYDAVTVGLQESSDANTYTYYMLASSDSKIASELNLSRYCLFGYNKENEVCALSLYQNAYTSYTASININRQFYTLGIDWKKGLFASSTSTAASGSNKNIDVLPVYSNLDLRYTDNIVAATTASTLNDFVRGKMIYVKGVIQSDGLFYLRPYSVTYNNKTYYRILTQTIPTAEEFDETGNRYAYIEVGFPYYNSNYANYPYSCNLKEKNDVYWFKNGEFRLVEDQSAKVDKVAGKGLSTNDYTNAEKKKVASCATLSDLANAFSIVNCELERDSGATIIGVPSNVGDVVFSNEINGVLPSDAITIHNGEGVSVKWAVEYECPSYLVRLLFPGEYECIAKSTYDGEIGVWFNNTDEDATIYLICPNEEKEHYNVDILKPKADKSDIGTLSSLTTNDKSNLVNAINDVNATAAANAADIVDIASNKADKKIVISSGQKVEIPCAEYRYDFSQIIYYDDYEGTKEWGEALSISEPIQLLKGQTLEWKEKQNIILVVSSMSSLNSVESSYISNIETDAKIYKATKDCYVFLSNDLDADSDYVHYDIYKTLNDVIDNKIDKIDGKSPVMISDGGECVLPIESYIGTSSENNGETDCYIRFSCGDIVIAPQDPDYNTTTILSNLNIEGDVIDKNGNKLSSISKGYFTRKNMNTIHVEKCPLQTIGEVAFIGWFGDILKQTQLTYNGTTNQFLCVNSEVEIDVTNESHTINNVFTFDIRFKNFYVLKDIRKNVASILDKTSLPVLVENKAEAKDVRRIVAQTSKVNVGKCVPRCPKAGQRYFFADGIIKFKLNSNILNWPYGSIEEGHCNREECDGKTKYFFYVGYEKPCILNITEDFNVKSFLEGTESYRAQFVEEVLHYNGDTTSPHLVIRDSKIVCIKNTPCVSLESKQGFGRTMELTSTRCEIRFKKAKYISSKDKNVYKFVTLRFNQKGKYYLDGEDIYIVPHIPKRCHVFYVTPIAKKRYKSVYTKKYFHLKSSIVEFSEEI